MFGKIKKFQKLFVAYDNTDNEVFLVKLTSLSLKYTQISVVSYLSTLIFAYTLFFINPILFDITSLHDKRQFLIINFIPVAIILSLLAFIHLIAPFVLTKFRFILNVLISIGMLGLLLIAFFTALLQLSATPLMYYISLIYLIAVSIYVKPLTKLAVYLFAFAFFVVLCFMFHLPTSDIISSCQTLVFNILLAMSVSTVLYQNAVNEHIKTWELIAVNDQLAQMNAKLLSLSETDFLTQLPNRRRFDDYLQKEWNKAVRNQTQLSLCILDVDFFKDYNDCYGHIQGDHCLVMFGEVLNASLKRNYDLAARYGGEEFAIIIPGAPPDVIVNICEHIRSSLASRQMNHKKSTVSQFVTASFGVVSIVPQRADSLQAFIQTADCALYKAKENGRNTIVSLDSLQTNEPPNKEL